MKYSKEKWDEEVQKALKKHIPLISPIEGKENIENYTRCLLGKDSKNIDIKFYNKLYCMRNSSSYGIFGTAVHKKIRKYVHEINKKDAEIFEREEGNDSMLQFLDWIDRNSDSSRGYIVYAFEAIERRAIWHEVGHIKTEEFCWGLRNKEVPDDEPGRHDDEMEQHADMYAVCLAMIKGCVEIEQELLKQDSMGSKKYQDWGFMGRYDRLKWHWENKTFGTGWESCFDDIPDHERLLIDAIRKHKRKQEKKV